MNYVVPVEPSSLIREWRPSRDVMMNWCTENIPDHSHWTIGYEEDVLILADPTLKWVEHRFSFYFLHAEDAALFRLTFGDRV